MKDGYSVPFGPDRDGNGSGILLFIREDIPSKLLPVNNGIEGFFVEINYVIRKNDSLVVHTILKKH